MRVDRLNGSAGRLLNVESLVIASERYSRSRKGCMFFLLFKFYLLSLGLLGQANFDRRWFIYVYDMRTYEPGCFDVMRQGPRKFEIGFWENGKWTVATVVLRRNGLQSYVYDPYGRGLYIILRDVEVRVSRKAANKLVHTLNGNVNTQSLSRNTLGIVEDDTDVGLAAMTRFAFPETPGSFREHLLSHQRGTSFTGAVIRQVNPFSAAQADQVFLGMEEDTTRASSMIKFEGGPLNLTSKKTTISLKKVIKAPDNQPYVLLEAVLIRFRPLVSAFAASSGVTITLVDTGVSSDETNPAVTFSKTLGCQVLMGLSYPLPVSHLKDLELQISVGATGMQRFRAWGTVELAFGAMFSTKPLTSGITYSKVLYELPSDILEVHAVDPRLFNAVLTQEDLDFLRDIQQDIPGSRNVNFGQNRTLIPRSQRLPVTLAEAQSQSLPSNETGLTHLTMDDVTSAAIARFRAMGYDVVPQSRSQGGFGDSTSSQGELSTSMTYRTGLRGVIGALVPGVGESGPAAFVDLPAGTEQALVPYRSQLVHYNLDEENPANNRVSDGPFPGSEAMTIGALIRTFSDITFH